MKRNAARADIDQTGHFAAMLAAMGTAPRLGIVRLLLAAHPEGMTAGDIAGELGIGNSTLSHHLDRLRTQGLVEVRRAGTFLHYTADTRALQNLLGFLYAECCTRNRVIEPATVTCCNQRTTT